MFSYSNPVKIVYSKEESPSLNNPSLICGFPGTGFVGKVAIDYLIKQLSAVHLADIFSCFYSPQITIKQDGTSEIVKNSIYYVKRENKKPKSRKNISRNYEPMKNTEQKVDNGDIPPVNKNIGQDNDSYLSQMDLILLTGDSQPIVPGSEYVLTEKILDVVTKFNISNIYSLAAYVTGTFTKSPRVFGTATNTSLVKTFRNHNVSSLDTGNITGMNGIIIGLGKMHGMDGLCLLGETSGYVIDANASKKILETITHMLSITVNMDEINKRAKDTELLIKNLEQQMMTKANQNSSGMLTEGGQDEVQQIFPQDRKSNMGYIS